MPSSGALKLQGRIACCRLTGLIQVCCDWLHICMLAATAPVSLAAAMLKLSPMAWADILFCNGGVLTTLILMMIVVTHLRMGSTLFGRLYLCL